ncbi:MAG TPA: porin [Opitutus sp.]|nr:porin [Opitutus sp.]
MKLAAVLALAASLPAVADVKINDNFSVSGYISGSTSYTEDSSGGVSSHSSFLDVDAVKLQSNVAFDKTTGTISLFTFTSHDPKILDAYATYKMSDTTTLTLGKFLSYLGFEAFDYPNMLQISYANPMAAFIPAYHSGVKFDFSSGEWSGGVAVLDSVYGPNYYQGDSDLDNGAGFEGFVKYSKGDSSIFAALAYDDGNGTVGSSDKRTTFDIWAQTKVGSTTLAAEYCYSNLDTVGSNIDGYFWLVAAVQPLSSSWSVTGRISGGEDDNVAISTSTPKFMKYTISPAITLTNNLGFLFEYSYIDFKNFSADHESFVAAQMIFKF